MAGSAPVAKTGFQTLQSILSIMNLACPALPLLLLAVPASAQTALLREGDPAPSSLPGQVITGISNTAVNQSGGYAATVSSSDGSTTISQVWGNLSGGPGALIREETTIGTLTQNSFESFFGISSSAVAYSPSCDEAGGSTGLDGVWLDSAIVGIEEMMIPGTTNFFSFGSRPGVTEDGIPYFVGGITDTLGGSTQTRGLFYGTSPTAVIQTGDLLPNLPAALSTASVDFDFRFSAMGTHSIVPVDLDTGGSTDDGAMTIDGSGLLLGGTLVQELNMVPASVGGIASENWDNFDFCGITEAGDYMFTGDTDGTTTLDEFIVRNGTIWAREGDIIDGQLINGAIESAFLSENNQLAYIWDIDVAGSNLEALYLEDTLLLAEGDEVDWDGDGSPDAGIVVENFTGINALTVDRNGAVYFTADVDVAGTTTEGYFVIAPGAVGTNYCMANANSTGVPATMTSTGSASLSANDLVIQSINMPNFAFGFFIVGQTQGFVMNPGGSAGNLCLAGDIGRGVAGGVANTAGTGMISGAVDWTSIPQPSGTVAAMIGDTWNFQCWMRDTDPFGMATSNFSDGYSVTVQ